MNRRYFLTANELRCEISTGQIYEDSLVVDMNQLTNIFCCLYFERLFRHIDIAWRDLSQDVTLLSFGYDMISRIGYPFHHLFLEVSLCFLLIEDRKTDSEL